MIKVELIRRLLDFNQDMTKKVQVRIVTRDFNGVVIAEQVAELESVGNFKESCTLNVTKSNLSPETPV